MLLTSGPTTMTDPTGREHLTPSKRLQSRNRKIYSSRNSLNKGDERDMLRVGRAGSLVIARKSPSRTLRTQKADRMADAKPDQLL